ncbi:hypothetical protein [Pontibacter sp. H249]|uniref:hypothetical protein n=1 Tax=Pontibacter sp. H249 TaxID=3133420 RepID=UPI0030BFBEF4
MKIKLLILSIALITSVNIAYAGTDTRMLDLDQVKLQNAFLKENSEAGLSTSDLGSCKINVYTELDNGTIIEGVVTVTADEINWFTCGLIKLYGVFSDKY